MDEGKTEDEDEWEEYEESEGEETEVRAVEKELLRKYLCC